MTIKQKPFRSKKYTGAAKDQSCVCCGAYDGTICARHYNGQRQHIYGKGRGIKCSDLATADLCEACETQFSEGINNHESKDERSEAFLHYCMLTIMRRVEQGVLK